MSEIVPGQRPYAEARNTKAALTPGKEDLWTVDDLARYHSRATTDKHNALGLQVASLSGQEYDFWRTAHVRMAMAGMSVGRHAAGSAAVTKEARSAPSR
jgi:hypothetical protein